MPCCIPVFNILTKKNVTIKTITVIIIIDCLHLGKFD